MTVTADALDLLAGDPPRFPKLPNDFHRHPETGAPYVNHPTETKQDGTPKRVLYGRPSSFGSALDNPFSLVKWKERQLLIGFWQIDAVGPIDPDDRDALDGLAARCHDAAGSHLAADQGTHIHRLCEYHDKVNQHCIPAELWEAGEALGIPVQLQMSIVNSWRRFRERMGLTALAVEQTVVNDRWRLAGTLDRLDVADHEILTAYGILEAGVPFVGDIKTGSLTVGNDGQPNWWTKYSVQIAAYVDAVPYDTETDERLHDVAIGWPLQPSPDIALIYHYDLPRALAGEVVDWQAIPVNVDAGREGGDLCRAAADFAKRRDLFAMPAPRTSDPRMTAEPIQFGRRSTVPSDQGEGEPAPSPDFAATVIPSTVEQPAADPAPSPTPTAGEGSAATPDDECTCDSLDYCTALNCPIHGPKQDDRARLRARVKDLVDQGHEQVMRRHWPDGVRTLKHDDLTATELAMILGAVRRVEAEVSAPFHPDDSPGTHSRQAIDRALTAWRDSGRDERDLWCAVALIATLRQIRNEDATIASIVAQFTIEQADRLYEAAGQ